MNLFDPSRPRNPLNYPILSPRQPAPKFSIHPQEDGKFFIMAMLLGDNDAYYAHSALIDNLILFFSSYIEDPEDTLELTFGWKAPGRESSIQSSLEDI